MAQPLCPQAQAPLGADELRQASEQNSRPFSAGQEQPGCAHDFRPLAGSGIMTSFQTIGAVVHDGVTKPNQHPSAPRVPPISRAVQLETFLPPVLSSPENGPLIVVLDQNQRWTPIPIHSTFCVNSCPSGLGPEKYSAKTWSFLSPIRAFSNCNPPIIDWATFQFVRALA